MTWVTERPRNSLVRGARRPPWPPSQHCWRHTFTKNTGGLKDFPRRQTQCVCPGGDQPTEIGTFGQYSIDGSRICAPVCLPICDCGIRQRRLDEKPDQQGVSGCAFAKWSARSSSCCRP